MKGIKSIVCTICSVSLLLVVPYELLGQEQSEEERRLYERSQEVIESLSEPEKAAFN